MMSQTRKAGALPMAEEADQQLQLLIEEGTLLAKAREAFESATR